MIETTIQPVTHDLGQFQVRRVLPSRGRTMVGPFIFVDEFGPAHLDAGGGMDVRPHPHINLATVTWLFEGAIDHRDSLGTFATIRPGQVNLMTAGRGIVHSERSPQSERADGPKLYGMQTWLALPDGQEEIDPAFEARTDLPGVEDNGAKAIVIMGELWGQRAPTTTHAATIYAEIALEPGGALPIDAEADERAVMLVGGEASIDGSLARSVRVDRARPRSRDAAVLRTGWPRNAAGRRSVRYEAPRLVELRQLQPRSHQYRQGRLACREIPARPRRQRRIHPTSRNSQDGELPMKPEGKVAWITGASSGIGAALARQWAARGGHAILSGRDTARLEAVAKQIEGETLILPFDVRDDAALAGATAQAIAWKGGVDLAVANAGISQRSAAIETALQVYREIIEVDLMAQIAFAQGLIGPMTERGSGALAFISSIAGKVGVPMRTAYSAAKFGLAGYAEALRAELSQSGVSVHTIFPGSIRTEVSRNALTADGSARGKSDQAIDEGLDPDYSAEKMLDAIADREREILVAEGAELAMGEARRAPDWLLDQVEAMVARGYMERLKEG